MINIKKIEFQQWEKKTEDNNSLFIAIVISFFDYEKNENKSADCVLDIQLSSLPFDVREYRISELLVLKDQIKTLYLETIIGFFKNRFNEIENKDEYIDKATSSLSLNWFTTDFDKDVFPWVKRKLLEIKTSIN